MWPAGWAKMAGWGSVIRSPSVSKSVVKSAKLISSRQDACKASWPRCVAWSSVEVCIPRILVICQSVVPTSDINEKPWRFEICQLSGTNFLDMLFILFNNNTYPCFAGLTYFSHVHGSHFAKTPLDSWNLCQQSKGVPCEWGGAAGRDAVVGWKERFEWALVIIFCWILLRWDNDMLLKIWFLFGFWVPSSCQTWRVYLCARWRCCLRKSCGDCGCHCPEWRVTDLTISMAKTLGKSRFTIQVWRSRLWSCFDFDSPLQKKIPNEGPLRSLL